jgi:hypothetical protein
VSTADNIRPTPFPIKNERRREQTLFTASLLIDVPSIPSGRGNVNVFR